MGALLRKDIFYTLRPWKLDTIVKSFSINFYVNYLVIDRLKEQTVRILPLYFFIELMYESTIQIDVNESFLWRYSVPGLSVLHEDIFKLAQNIIRYKLIQGAYVKISSLRKTEGDLLIV